jgi:MFS transporter, PAT family, beta-lactamase induction signal transducer AmpG
MSGVSTVNATSKKRSWSSIHRLIAVLVLGFSSGLPLALCSGAAIQAWMTTDGVDMATIGFFGLVGVPYTFKFLWAPLMDRFDLPLLGRRRGWLVLTQLVLAGLFVLIATIQPSQNAPLFAAVTVLIAFFSASQDIVLDAYRTDVLESQERALGASLGVFGYRLAMTVSGGMALLWASQWQSWAHVYRVMGVIMLVLAVFSLVALPAVHRTIEPLKSRPLKEFYGFAAMVAGVVMGYYFAKQLLILIGFDSESEDAWVRLLFLLSEVAVAMAMAFYLAYLAKFETLISALGSYFSRQWAWRFLLLIVLYKLGDAFALSLTTPFLMKGLGFLQEEVGIVNKVIGIWLTIVGALLGGFVMYRVRLERALFAFGILQLVAILGFYYLALVGKGAWGGFVLPAFDLWIVRVDHSSNVDYLLLLAVAMENITSGMGTAAFVALLMTLSRSRFSATHYALLSALASLGRVYVSPLSGVLSQTIGWPMFFLFAIVIGIPGVIMVWLLRTQLRALVSEADEGLPG